MPSTPTKMKPLSILAENSWKIEINLFPLCAFHSKTRVSLRYFVSYCRHATATAKKTNLLPYLKKILTQTQNFRYKFKRE